MKRIYRYAAACLFFLPALSALAVPLSPSLPPHPAAVTMPALVPAPAPALSPMPEPATLLLLGVGLLCIGIRRRRKTGKDRVKQGETE